MSAVGIVAFANSLANGFPFDDEFIIVKNPLIRGLRNIPILFVTDYWSGPLGAGTDNLYRPLVLTTYAINYAAGGLGASGYHLVNVVLHAAVSVVIFALCRRLGLTTQGSFAAAAVFAAHPIHSEAVAGIVGRAELLMALGLLLAWVWDLGRAGLAGFGGWRAAASLAAFVGALFSKEQAVVLPAILVLSDAVMAHSRRDADAATPTARRHLWPRYLLNGGVLVGYVAARWAALGGLSLQAGRAMSVLENPLPYLPLTTRALTTLAVAGKYLGLFVWPAHLSADYSYNAIPAATTLMDARVLAALAGWGLIIALGVIGWIRRQPALTLGAGLTLLTFLPASNAIVPISTIMGERLFYLPSVGLCLLLGAGWDRLAWATAPPGRAGLRWACLGVLAVALVALTTRTVIRNRDWHDTDTLFQSALDVVPRSAKVRTMYARSLVRRGIRLDEALQNLQAAAQIHASRPDPDAALVARAGRTQAPREPAGTLQPGVTLTEDMFRRDRPETAVLIDTVAQVYFMQVERSRSATRPPTYASIEPLFRRALDLRVKHHGPDHPEVAVSLNNLAGFYGFQGRYDEAEKLFTRALEIREKALGPDHPDVAASLNNLALLYYHSRRYGEAEPLYLRSIAITERTLGPEHVELAQRLENYAALLTRTNRQQEATLLVERARSIRAGAAAAR